MRKCDYFGNPWIGMFVKTNDEITLLPVDSLKKFEDKMAFLGTKIAKASIGESNLIGVYAAMNKKGIILPNIATEEECAAIRRLGINAYKSGDKHNANGNNICVNDKGGIINVHISKGERAKMEDALGVELVPIKIAGYSTVGSACIATNKGFLTHYRADDDEVKALEDALKVKGNRGTVNMGVGFVAYGTVANIKGYVTGEKSTAYELGRVVEALGFIDQEGIV
ncbi:translation initiation factor IF-6 [Candidatus Micrarchaeota archaeon]|nr:translation initiation factor IF-6 [Candidatus Micrarchaeota archaeon]